MFIYWTKLPPTTNNLYLNVYNKGRVIAPAYRTWQKQHPPSIGQHRSKLPISERFSIHYYVVKPDNRRRDLANFEKALTDSLVKHQVIKDDSQMDRLEMQWCSLPSDQQWAVKGVLNWTRN